MTDAAANARARAVFLDRDGVLNRAVVRDGKPYPPGNAAELELAPDAVESLGRLRRLGFALVVVTNQPDVARGAQTPEALEAIHRELERRLPPIEAILVCPHDDADRCLCRKPLPGLLHQAAARFGLDLASCFLIGDRWRDIDAGHAAGCAAVLIDYHYRERAPSREPEARVRSLAEAVDWIERTEQARR